MATRSKRQEREAAESVTAVETQRRIDALQQQFMEWGNGKKIELALVSCGFLLSIGAKNFQLFKSCVDIYCFVVLAEFYLLVAR